MVRCYRRPQPHIGQVSGGDASGDILIDIENLIGSQSGDTLIGDAGDNSLDGGDGDDHLIGGVGADTLIGGSAAPTRRPTPRHRRA
jgi:Ca2+-binding RTX toxin-like protein